MEHKITIVMATDSNYTMQTRITIWSMLKTVKVNTTIKIYILHNSLLEHQKKEEILELEKFSTSLEIEFLKVDTSIFERATTKIKYITITTFYRLIIADLVKEDKCIYLDADIIVNNDISSLFFIELGDNYVAGAKDPYCNLPTHRAHKEMLGIPMEAGYINAGVMVLNLCKLRYDKVTDRFLQLIDKGYLWMDQDIINKVCMGKIKYLDSKYNLFSELYGNCIKLYGISYDNQKVEKLEEEPVIIHYAGKLKPWKSLRTKGAMVWWEYAKEIMPSNIYEKMYQDVKEKDKIYEDAWKEIVRKCRQEENIIIFGFSYIGKTVFDFLEECGITNIVCFCDNAEEKQRHSYKDVSVCLPQEAVSEYPNALWINTSQSYSWEIGKQLEQLGVKEEKIVLYRE